MSKLSFRARALDATKCMPVYRKDEVADLPDYSVLNRAVPQMPTGMEKEEETEHHLQRAISAQQVYGDKKVMVIPVPEAEVGVDYYNSIYKKQFRVPKQYIHNQAQALNSIMEQEKPDYDMDSDDERWVHDTNRRTGLEISDIQFEEMIDRLEKSCGNQLVSLQEAKLLLKEDDDLIKAVYEYWLQKRAKSFSGSLTFQVRQERRDGSSSGDSYVAFRRRTEKMQTRKNRKNDEASYEKMLKLRRDLTRAVTILEMVKRREKCKWELLHLTLEVAEKRYQMRDWDGKCLKMAKREVAIGHGNLKAITGGRVKHISGSKLAGASAATVVKHRIKSEIEREKRRRSKKNKEKLRFGLLPTSVPVTSLSVNAMSTSSLPGTDIQLSSQKSAQSVIPKSPSYSAFTYEQAVDTMKQYEFHSSDEDTARPKSPMSGSVAPTDDRKKNADGNYAFLRKLGCRYEAPCKDLGGDEWPWMSDDRHRYSLTTLSTPEKCMGFCRRRVGRGGRVLLDRAYSAWKKQFCKLDLHPEPNHLPHNQSLQQLLEEIKHGRWRRYRPYSPAYHDSQKVVEKCWPLRNTQELDLKPFGHPVQSQANCKDLLHKRLLAKSARTKSPQKNKSSLNKRLFVHGGQLDKPSALFAVSALVMSDSSPKTKMKCGRSHQTRVNVVSSSLPIATSNTAVGQSVCGGGMTFFGNITVASPGKYISNVISSPQEDATVLKKSNAGNRLALDQAKLYGVKTQEKVHATLMPIANLQPKSSTTTSVTIAGSSAKVSLATFNAQSSGDGVSLSMPLSSKITAKGGITSTDSANDSSILQKPSGMPVVMAALRISHTASTVTSSPTTQTTASSHGDTILSNSYGLSNQSGMPADSSGSSGTVFIAPTRSQQLKGCLGELQVSGNPPLSLSTVNSTTLVPSQYKHAQHGVLLGSQSLNLALTPANSQKHATLSQLSIPNSSGHTPAILIATPASATLTSSLPPHCNSSAGGGATLNLMQGKAVSINVARVQPSSSGMGQIFTLQQHPDGNIGTLTVSGSQQHSSQHPSSSWVSSGSGPNILKLGPPGAQTGIQIHPVTAGFKMGSNNKSLTVISKRPRGQQATANQARTISIANSKQLGGNHSKIQGVPSQITLVPDNRSSVSSKPLISITPKNNATVVLSAKNAPLEQPFPICSDSTPTHLSTQSDNIVTDAAGLNNKTSKNNQPMEVT